MKPYKLIALLLVTYATGYIIADRNTQQLWQDKLDQAVKNQRHITQLMVETEVAIAKQETIDEFVGVLMTTCLNSSRFAVVNKETKEELVFTCKLEDEGEYTMARW